MVQRLGLVLVQLALVCIRQYAVVYEEQRQLGQMASWVFSDPTLLAFHRMQGRQDMWGAGCGMGHTGSTYVLHTGIQQGAPMDPYLLQMSADNNHIWWECLLILSWVV